MEKKDKKSRRRFLADMLFVGGGLTAAALVAKTGLERLDPDPPAIAGDMVAPSDPGQRPCHEPSPSQSTPPAEGESIIMDGDFVQPEACPDGEAETLEAGKYSLPEASPETDPSFAGDYAPPQPLPQVKETPGTSSPATRGAVRGVLKDY